MTDRQAGFTLVETLVALFALSVLAAAGSAMLIQTLQAREQVAARSELLKELELARAVMKADFAQAAARPVRAAEGGASGVFFDGGIRDDADGQTLVSLVRRGWDNPGGMESRGSVQSVRYRIEEGALVRIAALRADAYRTTPERRQILLRGVSGAEIAFSSAGQWSDIWFGAQQTAGGVNRLPEQARISLDVEGLGRLDQRFLIREGAF